MFRMVVRRTSLVTLISLFFLITVSSSAVETVDIKGLDVSVSTTVVTVGNTATKIPASPLSGRRCLTIQNIATTTVIYIGDSTVTANEAATGGYQLAAEWDTITLDLTDEVDVYGIVAVGTAKVVVVEVR